jgi:hypothetical protein
MMNHEQAVDTVRAPDPSGGTEASGSWDLTASDISYTNPGQITGERQAPEATRAYECLGCAAVLQTFCRPCPTCGARSFTTVTAGERRPEGGTVGDVLAVYARVTAPYNPYIPR